MDRGRQSGGWVWRGPLKLGASRRFFFFLCVSLLAAVRLKMRAAGVGALILFKCVDVPKSHASAAESAEVVRLEERCQ